MMTIAGSSSDEPPIQFDDDVRTSKRLTKDEGDELIPQSALEVMSNDDLLIEILVRLPFLSLCLLKSVSKCWLSLIRHLNFTRPSRVFIKQTKHTLWRRSYVYDFLPFDVGFPKNITTFPFGSPGKFVIRQSCNGLLLCQQMETQTYYVYNPTIKQFKELPRCYHGCVTMRMAFDPTKSPHYTVLCMSLTKISDTSIQLHTYNSETCKWRVYGDHFSYEDFRYFNSGIYWNGAIHWIASGHYYKLDVQHPLLTRLSTPYTQGQNRKVSIPIYKLCISRGSLLFISLGSHELGVYEMKNGYSNKWSKMYIVNLEDVIRNERPQSSSSSILGIVEGEREEDLLVVLNLNGNVVQYNIMLKTVHKLGRPVSSYEDRIPFVASFAHV